MFYCADDILQMGLGGDLVALWEVPLNDGVHKIGFEHGTTTGRRVLWVDGEVRFKYELFLFILK